MKKAAYIILSTLLGITLSFILHAIIEYYYIISSQAGEIFWYSSFGKGSCALPEWFQYTLFAVGIIGGLIMGFWWWKIVYIQKRHWRNKTPNL